MILSSKELNILISKNYLTVEDIANIKDTWSMYQPLFDLLLKYFGQLDEPKKKARGFDFKILEIMRNEPAKKWQPTFIVDRIRPSFPDKSRDELLSKAWLGLSRLYSDGYIKKIDRGVYVVGDSKEQT